MVIHALRFCEVRFEFLFAVFIPTLEKIFDLALIMISSLPQLILLMFLTVVCCQILHGVPVAAGLLLLLPAHLHPQRALHLSPAGESRDRGN